MKGLVEMFFNLFGKRNLLTAKSGDPDFEKEKVSFLQSIKLVHCSNLQTWHKFPRYQQCDAITYYDYFIGQQQLKKLESAYSHVIGAYNKLAQLDTGEVKVYKTFTVEVAPSLFHTIRGISLAMPAFEETVVTVNEGEWQAGKLIVKAKWSKKSVQVTYACPSHIQNAEEIAVTRKKISELTADEQAAFHEIKKSRFSQPVLFISHRWETKNHPDPDCNQLEKLRLLEDCFIIYDYCSFPQEPLNIDEASKLQCILKYMGKLIENVVILHSADYTNRGWCIYEYIASSFLSSVVCDEIQEPAFVALRDWVSTRVPFQQIYFVTPGSHSNRIISMIQYSQT